MALHYTQFRNVPKYKIQKNECDIHEIATFFYNEYQKGNIVDHMIGILLLEFYPYKPFTFYTKS